MSEQIDMDALWYLAAPLCMSLILVGIHCYLGIHVLARGVIFVDLALAQVAALGSLFPFLFYDAPSSRSVYFASLITTLVAAGFLTLSNRLKNISQEAIIGIVFAFSSAALVLIAGQMPHGSDHIKHSMVGQLLWTSWQDVLKVLLIYSGVSICYYVWRKPLIENSFGRHSNWKMDLLFYGLFAIVITSSVQVAGILIVFSFLIVPAFISSYIFQSTHRRLFFGWGIGAGLSTLGMIGSYYWDVPSGAFIVLLFSATAILFVAAKALLS